MPTTLASFSYKRSVGPIDYSLELHIAQDKSSLA